MTGSSETSGTLGVGTGAVGLALVTASGLAVFGLAEYGPGVGTAALVGFGVVALALAAVGTATDVTDWGVAIPVGLVWVALVVVRPQKAEHGACRLDNARVEPQQRIEAGNARGHVGSDRSPRSLERQSDAAFEGAAFDASRLVSIAERYGVEILPPPVL